MPKREKRAIVFSIVYVVDGVVSGVSYLEIGIDCNLATSNVWRLCAHE